MGSWYQWPYAAALCFAAFRSVRICRILPFWSLTIALGLYAAAFGASPLLVLAIGLSRVLMGVEAYVRLTISRPWVHGARLLVTSWLLAAGAALLMRFFLGPRQWDIFAVRRYVSVWDGLWLLFALLFFATWGEIRVRKSMCFQGAIIQDDGRVGGGLTGDYHASIRLCLSPALLCGRSWRHVLFVFGLVGVEAAGALAKLAKVDDAGFWWWDRVIYLGMAGLLIGWGFSVPRSIKAARSCRQAVSEVAPESFLARGSV